MDRFAVYPTLAEVRAQHQEDETLIWNDPKTDGVFDREKYMALAREWRTDLKEHELYETFVGLARFLNYALIRLQATPK